LIPQLKKLFTFLSPDVYTTSKHVVQVKFKGSIELSTSSTGVNKTIKD